MCWAFFFQFQMYHNVFSVCTESCFWWFIEHPSSVLLWDGALLSCSYPVHNRLLPSTALKTFCSLHYLLALITVTSVCHIWSPGGAEDPEAVSIPSVGRGKLSLSLRWGSGWFGSPLLSVMTLRLRGMESFQMPISHVQIVGKTGLS